MRRAAKIDDNHREIVKAFKKAGAAVLDIHTLPNCCDIAIAYKNVTVMVEIKDGSKVPSARKLTPGELAFKEYWAASGGKWALVETIGDVSGLVGSITSNAKMLLESKHRGLCYE